MVRIDYTKTRQRQDDVFVGLELKPFDKDFRDVSVVVKTPGVSSVYADLDKHIEQSSLVGSVDVTATQSTVIVDAPRVHIDDVDDFVDQVVDEVDDGLNDAELDALVEDDAVDEADAFIRVLDEIDRKIDEAAVTGVLPQIDMSQFNRDVVATVQNPKQLKTLNERLREVENEAKTKEQELYRGLERDDFIL